MQKMTLATRLIGGFLIVASITLVVGFLGWKEISDSNESNTRAVFSENISKQLLQREIDHLNWAIKVGEFQRNEEMTELGVEKDDHKCNFGKWYYSEEREKAGTAVPEIKGLLDKLEEPHRKLHQSAVQLEETLKKGKEHRPQALSLFQKETISHLKSVQQLLGEIRARTEQHVTEARKTSDLKSDRAKLVSLTGMVAGPVVALILGVILSFSIAKLIRRVISELKEGAAQVSSASGQVSLAGQQLAEGTSEQAAAIEESSSSLEEMASMTRQNAEHAGHANELMRNASQVTEKASRSMTELTASMETISKASEETQKIIKTIDEIAFQTNLLALNAAVEAARAGEAGAGFAVVADEVRSLAMRAAEAARSTTTLIEGSTKQIRQGAALVNRTNDDFTEVTASIGKVGELVEEISAASQEQAQGIDQINKAVSEMDRVTQQNAASAEESAAAAQQLHAQAEQMMGFVQELVILVGGEDTLQKSGKSAKSSKREFRVKASAAVAGNPCRTRPQSLLTSDKKGNGRGPAICARGKVDALALPGQALPLEEDMEKF